MCQVLLTTQTGLVHVRGAHVPSYTKMSEEEYRAVCVELMIRDEYPALDELDGGAAIGGLTLFMKTLVCGVDGCGKLFTSGGSIRKHYNGIHSIRAAQAPIQYNVTPAQRIDNNHHRILFHVVPPPGPSTSSLDIDWIDRLDAEIGEEMQKIELGAVDPRFVNALLKKTRWLEHVCGYEPAELRSLVALPTADEIPQLKGIMVWIVDTAMNTASFAPSTLLQKLNTKDIKL